VRTLESPDSIALKVRVLRRLTRLDSLDKRLAYFLAEYLLHALKLGSVELFYPGSSWA
jgi:hypothetical protein